VRPALASGATRVELAGARDDHGTTVVVADDGAAPADGALERLFEPFSRARGSGPYIGAGVSLVICRRIIERHGGALAAEVGDDGRLALSFTLPAAS
jgi:signal transduction histidine kinase